MAQFDLGPARSTTTAQLAAALKPGAPRDTAVAALLEALRTGRPELLKVGVTALAEQPGSHQLTWVAAVEHQLGPTPAALNFLAQVALGGAHAQALSPVTNGPEQRQISAGVKAAEALVRLTGHGADWAAKALDQPALRDQGLAVLMTELRSASPAAVELVVRRASPELLAVLGRAGQRTERFEALANLLVAQLEAQGITPEREPLLRYVSDRARLAPSAALEATRLSVSHILENA